MRSLSQSGARRSGISMTPPPVLMPQQVSRLLPNNDDAHRPGSPVTPPLVPQSVPRSIGALPLSTPKARVSLPETSRAVLSWVLPDRVLGDSATGRKDRGSAAVTGDGSRGVEEKDSKLRSPPEIRQNSIILQPPSSGVRRRLLLYSVEVGNARPARDARDVQEHYRASPRSLMRPRAASSVVGTGTGMHTHCLSKLGVEAVAVAPTPAGQRRTRSTNASSAEISIGKRTAATKFDPCVTVMHFCTRVGL